ncbi:FadD3 family acyl-CoA ligase [Endozoicomonas elysicola]|uniref:Fatty acid--CoA ligase n=1 Tax=Endozoicomonas elysicola TaxID=305900 RepID=A0A081KA52_9GAMM|nr:FadD3 family acyl-CoA ligase [Endozoicomonas elysicola]KEI71028.1 fatty acid--CoA ligase [Endozoicomonas elysicola]
MIDLQAVNTIPDLMDAAANTYGSRSAIEDENVTLSFIELNELRLKAAASLLSMGVKPGDRIAVWAPNIYEWIVAATALQTVGAALVPLNTRMKGSEAGYVLRASGAKLLFCIHQFLNCQYPDMLEGEALPELETIVTFRGQGAENCISWNEFLQKSENTSSEQVQLRQQHVASDSMSDLLFTSGTTGKPKGVMTSHGQNLQVVEDWSGVVGLTEADRYLIVNPFFHSFGYKAGWMAALMRGCTILPLQIFDVSTILQMISDEKVSVLPGPPTLYQSILAHPELDTFDISSLRVAVTGAAAIPVSMIHQMRDELGFDTIITAYGLTEVCGFATICRSGDDPELIANTSGRAMPGIEVCCVDGEGNKVAAGVPGEVVIRGYNLMQGYFENPEATAETIDSDGWLHTGDIGVMDEQGYLKITDRMKDMFITGGFNVYPAEIENLMSSHKAIAQVAVVGIPDERMGEVAMAYIIPVSGESLSKDDVVAWCRQEMANYKVPRHVAIVDSLPTNASGKVLKFELRESAKKLV